jgi:hypothetical protein
MNKVILCVLIGFLAWSAILMGCSERKKEGKSQEERTVNRYKCPMGCTGEIFEKPGKCPNCGTDLIEITAS